MPVSNSWRIIRTLMVSFFLSVVLLLILTFLLYKFRLPEPQVTIGINLVYIVSCLVGGFIAGKTMKTKRFFWGLLIGLLYFAVLLAMSCLQDQSVTAELPELLTVLAICAGSGMAGGMIS